MFRLIPLLLLVTLVATAAPATAQERTYPNSYLLTDPVWLQAHLADADLRVVDLSPASTYAAGHIPGAVNLEWEQLRLVDTSDPSIEAWRGEVEQLLGDLGIAPEHTVVVYDEGSLYAARLFWVLEQLGHVRVRLLDGGFPAWQAAGLAVSTAVPSPAAVRYVGSPRPELIAGWAEVLGKLGQPEVVLVDARSPAEYRGEDVRAARGGHIPGAVNIPFTDNAQAEPPRFFKPASELLAMYTAQGVTREKEVIAYCSSGVRSAVTYFTLRLLNYPSVKLYSGSWDEWGNRPDLPLE